VPGVQFVDDDDRLLYHASERELRAAMDAGAAGVRRECLHRTYLHSIRD